MVPRETFKKALEDVPLEIVVIAPKYYDILSRLIRSIPVDGYVSEWKHAMGEARYEYHIHGRETGENLKKLFEKNIHGGNPKLAHVYSHDDLVSLVQEKAEV